MSSMHRETEMMRMRTGSAITRAYAWLADFAASCGLIPATVTLAVPSVKNGPSRRLEHPT